MFWGLNLKPNRKYSQTATKAFHISQAALEAENASNSDPNQIFIISENQKFLICTLRKDTCEQVMLDLNVAEGDEICFQSVGNGHVTLSGYLVEEDNPFMLNNEEEEEEESDVDEKIEEDLRNTLNKKAKKGNAEKAVKSKQTKSEEEDDDDEDDDSDLNGTDEFGEDDDDDDDDEDDDDEDEDDEDDEEDDSEDEEVQEPKAKQPKLDKLQKKQNGADAGNNEAKQGKQQKKQNGVGKNSAEKEKKDNKKENTPQQQKAGGERTLAGGVKVEDIRVGNGPEVKAGKRAQVYYEGRLKSNNKVFDSLKTGNGFKFNIGRGEVIKGWDVGVVGMKVGGRRRIVCPPHMAYGARGSPPTIPPNSTLVFEVELKGVN